MKKPRSRIAITLIFFAFTYMAIIFKLFNFQIVNAEKLKEAGINQSSESLTIKPVRGEIRTSDNFPLAANTINYLLYANPKVIDEKQKTATLLAEALDIEKASISAELEKDLFWTKLADEIPLSKKEEIEKLAIDGLGFQQQDSRIYPESSMAAHLLGFVGKDDNASSKGYFGIEGFYDQQLRGREGRLYAIIDALGNPIVSDIREESKIDGRTLTLTLDRQIQFFAEKRLKEGIERYEAEGGSVIIMQPKTGKVLAMASFPQFDPRSYAKFPPDIYVNPVTSKLYEPGSTFKVLVMAAGLNEGVISPDSKCDICDGPVQIGEYSIRTWNGQYYPQTDMTDVIKHSDNTGMVYVGRKLGVEKLNKSLESFGIYEQTGIDLQGEVSANERENWYPIDLATASFGQGITVTPIQLLTAVSSIANDGELMRPYVVEKITTHNNEIININPKKKRNTVSKKAAKEITAMMMEAVEEGDSKWVQLEGYDVAGKTGTAQIPVQGHYDPNQTIASFVGFFPANDPEISMLVLVDRPKSSIYGSETAAPIFFEIANDIVSLKNISN